MSRPGLCLALLLLAPAALAQSEAGSLSRLRPATGPDGLVTVEGARGFEDDGNAVELQLGFDAAWLPSRASTLGLGRAGRLDRRLGGFLGLQALLQGRTSVFAQLPVTLREGGDVSALTGSPSFGFGVGDARVGVRTGLLRQELDGLDLAALAAVEFATAPAGSFAGDGRLGGEALISVGRRFEGLAVPVQLLGNLVLRLRPPRDLGAARLGNEVGLRGGAALLPAPGAAWKPRRAYLELDGSSSLRALDQRSAPLEWRAGLTFCPTPSAALEAAAGTRLDDGAGAPSLRGALILRYAPGLCTAPKTGPAPPRDDEFLAAAQREAAASAERQRVDEALVRRSEEAAVQAARDAEARDLVAGSEAAAAALARRYAQEDLRDTDGDGVPDRLDNCPREPGPASNHGCPLAFRQRCALRADRIEAFEPVYFALGKAHILERSHPLLDQVARILREHPDLRLVRVEGHTDPKGSPRFNAWLSLLRAQEVVRYLAKRGVARERLVAQGFGPTRPIAPNRTREGREKNRRAGFKVLERVSPDGRLEMCAPDAP